MNGEQLKAEIKALDKFAAMKVKDLAEGRLVWAIAVDREYKGGSDAP